MVVAAPLLLGETLVAAADGSFGDRQLQQGRTLFIATAAMIDCSDARHGAPLLTPSEILYVLIQLIQLVQGKDNLQKCMASFHSTINI
jgi:hypothetical protein